MRRLDFAVLLALLLLPACAGAKDEKVGTRSDLLKRVEVGKVKWGRDIDAALKESKKSGRPVLVLFQEVPG